MTKKAASQDWHKADIRCALHKRGITFKSLSIALGYKDVCTVAQALHHPYPKMESVIADAIGEKPQTIWPSRYHEDGTPRSRRGERGLSRLSRQSKALRDAMYFNASSDSVNVNFNSEK
jgi:Ner family transcriptional regulator